MTRSFPRFASLRAPPILDLITFILEADISPSQKSDKTTLNLCHDFKHGSLARLVPRIYNLGPR